MDPIAVLPRELGNVIFSHLPFRELALAQTVSTTWRSFLEDDKIWRAAYLGDVSVPSTERLKLRLCKESVNWKQTCRDYATLQYAWRSGNAKQVWKPIPVQGHRDCGYLMIDATNDKVAFSGNSTTFIYSLPSLELDCEIKGFRFNAMEVPGVGLVVVRERRRSRPNRILDLGVWIPTVTAERFGVVPDTSPPADPPSYQNFEYTHLVELTPQPNPFLGHSAVLHLDRPDSDSPVLLLLQVDGQTVTLRRFDQAAAVETYTPSKPIYGDAEIGVDGDYIFVGRKGSIEVLSRAMKQSILRFGISPTREYLISVDEPSQPDDPSEVKGQRFLLSPLTEPHVTEDDLPLYGIRSVNALGRNLVIECDGAIAVVCDYTSVFEQAATQTNRDAFVAKHTIGIIPDIEPHIERLDIDYDYMFVKYGYRFAVVLKDIIWIFDDEITSEMTSLPTTVITGATYNHGDCHFAMDDTGIYELCHNSESPRRFENANAREYVLRKISFAARDSLLSTPSDE